jgi:hypothetical protein
MLNVSTAGITAPMPLGRPQALNGEVRTAQGLLACESKTYFRRSVTKLAELEVLVTHNSRPTPVNRGLNMPAGEKLGSALM